MSTTFSCAFFFFLHFGFSFVLFKFNVHPMLCFSKNRTDSVSAAPVRHPVVQSSFKSHIPNRRGWARGMGGEGRSRNEELNAHAGLSIPPAARAIQREACAGRATSVRPLPAPCRPASFPPGLRRFTGDPPRNLPKQPFTASSKANTQLILNVGIKFNSNN